MIRDIIGFSILGLALFGGFGAWIWLICKEITEPYNERERRRNP